MKVKFAYGIVQGSDNDGQGGRGKIRTVSENGTAVIFLAGSVAGIAAELTAERFDELYASDENYIKEELSGNKRDGALLFVAVKGNRYLAGHMGDGLIARLDESSYVLSKPEAEDDDRLRIYRGALQGSFGFMLMSGEACRSLYDSGAGTLSPACGTFFGWLEEYDEETVSEALVDNINKYFLKDGKGDISIGMMVSAEEEIAVAELPEEETTVEELIEQLPIEEEPVRESGSRGKIVKYLIAAAIVLTVIFVFAMKPDVAKLKDAEQPENKPPVTNSENNEKPEPESESSAQTESNEPSVTFSVDNPEAYDAGEYQIGEDIPAGEYFFWTGEMLQPDSIKVNGETCLSGELYCMTVEVKEGDTLSTDVKFTAAGNVNPVKATNGSLISGKYKIGKDVTPGEYRISPMDKNADGKYYSIRGGEISNDEAFSRETTVVVPEAGYIVFYNAVLEY